MALIIRLRQQGKKNRHSFRLVVADERSPRDGKCIERLGFYDPRVKENNFTVIPERVEYWINQGALCSERVQILLKKTAPDVIKRWHEKQDKKRSKKCK